MTNIEKVFADHTMSKHLGNWTTARTFDVRARRGAVVIDLRSPQIADGDLELHLDIDHGMVKLLLPSGATVDQWGLQWSGRGRVKDFEGPTGDSGRRVVLTGRVASGEVRIHRGGVAILSAMCSRAYVRDVWRAYKAGGLPTVDDPSRVA